MIDGNQFNVSSMSGEIRFNILPVVHSTSYSGDLTNGRTIFGAELKSSNDAVSLPRPVIAGPFDEFGCTVLPDAAAGVLRRHVLGEVPPHVEHVDREDVAIFVQSLHVLVSVRGIPRHVRAVRALVARLFTIARAHHVPLEMHLPRVTVGTVQALIRSYVPGTVAVPPLIS